MRLGSWRYWQLRSWRFGSFLATPLVSQASWSAGTSATVVWSAHSESAGTAASFHPKMCPFFDQWPPAAGSCGALPPSKGRFWSSFPSTRWVFSIPINHSRLEGFTDFEKVGNKICKIYLDLWLIVSIGDGYWIEGCGTVKFGLQHLFFLRMNFSWDYAGICHLSNAQSKN